MAVVFTNGVYPYVTLAQDAHGNLHLWEGQVNPGNHSTLPKADGRESDTFIQREDDREALLEYLDNEEKDLLITGYSIQTKHIPDDYLVHE